jgi:HTH-type transcriptional regulator, transcriptional repressor of NAD biosynthesis genes
MTRVVIVGAESTGKTTLAVALAEHYQTTWVPEFGRLYTEARRPSGELWHSDEFTFIATEQVRMEDALERIANRVLICDTDAFATAIWHERYLGVPSADVLALAASRRYDLYVLTDVDTPFVPDDIRDGESIREWMHKRFRDDLSRMGVPVLFVSGPHEQRLAAAIARIDTLLP